jgi:cysteine desulfuration protein SufE
MSTTAADRPSAPRDAQDEIIDEFALFGDWSERYQYIIDLGRQLPALADDARTEEHKVSGCQSQVWIVPHGNAERLAFAAASDSAIVQGLIALALRVYSGLSAVQILDTSPRFIDAIGLRAHLSPTRSNGLAAVLASLRRTAQRALAGERFV